MKDPAFLSSPVYPPILPSKPSLSTNRDDYLVPNVYIGTNWLHDHFTLKSQITSLYMHPIGYTFKLFDKNQVFFLSIASKIMPQYQYWLESGVKSFLITIHISSTVDIRFEN